MKLGWMELSVRISWEISAWSFLVCVWGDNWSTNQSQIILVKLLIWKMPDLGFPQPPGRGNVKGDWSCEARGPSFANLQQNVGWAGPEGLVARVPTRRTRKRTKSPLGPWPTAREALWFQRVTGQENKKGGERERERKVGEGKRKLRLKRNILSHTRAQWPHPAFYFVGSSENQTKHDDSKRRIYKNASRRRLCPLL